ncbi:hypothetical protein [Shewanella holmiensis]|uniref:Uncharacterized protein n=1 Tax=Shewanella holmiensis TaxID=2952222 RepID=A0A9X2WQD9_9GAMM|nr:hypothetical protein [Shewanella holmiensis]MCT7943603.1 hypothetical protein [Shewanella holmiensis]
MLKIGIYDMRKKSKTTKAFKTDVAKQEPHTQRLTFENMFEVVDKDNADFLKENSDMLIVIRDVLTANQISNSVEHLLVLKRIEQLWGVEPESILGRELDKLANIVCKYEDQILS